MKRIRAPLTRGEPQIETSENNLRPTDREIRDLSSPIQYRHNIALDRQARLDGHDSCHEIFAQQATLSAD